MNKYFVNQLVIAALVGAAAFTSCNNDDDDNGNGNEKYLFAGKFSSQTGTGDAVFYADYVSNTKFSANEKELGGKIKDNDIIFTLRGFHDVAKNLFYLSAGSTNLVFQIAGTLTDGKMSNTKATVKKKSGDEWTVQTVSVTSSDNVSIDGSASNTQADGIPTAWFGNWAHANPEDDTEYYTITSWHFIPHGSSLYKKPTEVLDIVSLGNGRLEIIQELYIGDEILYSKIWMEERGQGLLVTAFNSSFSETYGEAKSYDTATAEEESIYEVILSRL